MLWFWKILCLPCDTSPKRYLPHPACHRWGAQPLATCSIGSGALEPYLEPPQKSNSWNLSILNHHQSSEILREIFGWMDVKLYMNQRNAGKPGCNITMWQIFVLKNDSVVNPRKLYCKLPWILLGENDTFQVFLKCSTLKLKNLYSDA